MPTPKRSISSRVAKQNPRPRKYATAAERQKALRERFPTLCVRVEQEQADFMKRIADEQGRTLQDVHLAFIKYANGRGNQWLTQGLKGFAPLPRFEETPKENPMKRKPTPAQIAARERFAEMARSGAFKKKAAKAKKAKAAPKRNPRASNPIILVSDKPITSKRKANPVKPKDMTVYQVQYRKPGMKLFEPWMTVMYPKMAEDIARRLADEPMAQTWTIKVESIKVKG